MPLQHVFKRRKRSHRSEFQFPPEFFDNLSKIDLTKAALEELDRRNTQAILNSRPPYLRPDRRITRRVLAELKKNIKRMARHGGLDLSDLRGFPKPPNPAMTTDTPTIPSIGPYIRLFQQNLIDGGVYPHAYRYPDGRVPAKPNNWEEINRRLSQPRPSLSPSSFPEEAFAKFVQADADAVQEKQVTTAVIPVIEGDIRNARCVSGGIPFTNLDPLTEFKLVPGNPDIYYGARPEQLDRRVREELGGHITPSTQDDLPIAPNFFLATKGPDGLLTVAGRQASYDGALGARGMRSLESYGQEEPVVVNTASTISSIYHGGQLKMFTIHASQPTSSGGPPEYCMHQLRAFAMTDTAETFRQGATYYRNGRDWAQEQRDEAIRRANGRVDERRARTLAIDANLAQASSFTSEAKLNGTYTTEAPTEESQTSRAEKSNRTAQASGASSGEPSVDHRASVKRSSERSKGSPQPQRKGRKPGDSDYDLSQRSKLQTSESSGLSQQLGNRVFEEADRQSSRDDLQQISTDTSVRTDKSASKEERLMLELEAMEMNNGRRKVKWGLGAPFSAS